MRRDNMAKYIELERRVGKIEGKIDDIDEKTESE